VPGPGPHMPLQAAHLSPPLSPLQKFLDAMVDDAAWLARYARNAAGEPVPWAVVEAHARATRPYAVLGLRAMLAVSFFEKALYELPDEEVTPDRVASLADEGVPEDARAALGAMTPAGYVGNAAAQAKALKGVLGAAAAQAPR